MFWRNARCVRPGNYASGVATTVTRLTPAIESFAKSMCRRLNPQLLRRLPYASCACEKWGALLKWSGLERKARK
jgi:hypothetical protein